MIMAELCLHLNDGLDCSLGHRPVLISLLRSVTMSHRSLTIHPQLVLGVISVIHLIQGSTETQVDTV